MKKVVLLSLTMLALGLCLLPGCFSLKEYEDVPPAGKVVAFGTNEPIAGATVSLYECEGEVLGSFNCWVTATTTTDANGRYAFKQPGFSVNATKPQYFSDDNTSQPVLAYTETNTDIALPPYAWLKVTLKNESGAYAISVPSKGPLLNGGLVYLEQNQDATFLIFAKGNQDYKYIFSVTPTQNAPSTNDLDAFKIFKGNQKIEASLENSFSPWFNIYLPGHDTTSITITY